MNRIYLDHNATAPLRPEARDLMLHHLRDVPVNASSVHGFGHRAKMGLESAREQVARLVNSDPDSIVLTGGGTEGNNLAIYGLAHTARPHARRIVTSAFEHPSVSAVVDDLETRGYDVVRVRPDRSGIVSAGAFLEAAPPGSTAVASLMLANHEIGTLQPVSDIGAELRRRGIPFHCDAVQAAGRVPIDVGRLSVDLLTIASHKIGGPHGAGAMYVRRGVDLAPHLRGGGQESNRRPGTENIAAIAGFGAAAGVIHERLADEIRRMAALRERLESGVLRIPGAPEINGALAPRIPNTSSLAFEGIPAEALVVALDLEGIAISAGAACSSGTIRSSPSLEAMGRPEEAATSIRVSIGPGSSEASIDRFIEVLTRVLLRLRQTPVFEALRVRA